MESNKRRLILRTILAVLLIAAAIGIIGALTPKQGTMKPTSTITSSLGDTARCACGNRDATHADDNHHGAQ